MPHVVPVLVEPGDIDELGHASNVSFVRWMLAAAVGHTTAAGLTPEDYKARGHGFFVRRHEIDYLLPALAGDALEAVTWVVEVRAVSCLRATILRRPRDGAVLMRAESHWAYIDLVTGRPARIPRDVRDRFPVEGASGA